MDESIIQYIRKKYNLLIGERTAEIIKKEIGCADIEKAATYGSMDIRGRDMVSGLPKTVEIQAIDVANAIHDVVESIILSVREVLEETPPEISADVIDHGIVLTGGGALLKNIAEVISAEAEVPVFIANDPLDCVAIGTGETLKNINIYKRKSFKQ